MSEKTPSVNFNKKPEIEINNEEADYSIIPSVGDSVYVRRGHGGVSEMRVTAIPEQSHATFDQNNQNAPTVDKMISVTGLEKEVMPNPKYDPINNLNYMRADEERQAQLDPTNLAQPAYIEAIPTKAIYASQLTVKKQRELANEKAAEDQRSESAKVEEDQRSEHEKFDEIKRNLGEETLRHYAQVDAMYPNAADSEHQTVKAVRRSEADTLIDH